MGDIGVGQTDQPDGTGIVPVRARSRGIAGTGLFTTLTADPGAAGTALAIAAYPANWPASGSFKIRVENEVVLVTAGHGTTSLTVTRQQDGTTGAAHAIGVVAAYVMAEQYVIPINERVVAFEGSAASFRTLGNAASPQNLFSIENAAGSGVLVAVRRFSIQMDSTAALIAVATQFTSSRPTALPTGGTALSKVGYDTAQTSSASVVVRGANASDAGAATAITATAGARIWHQFAMRLQTLAGQVIMDDESLLPTLVADNPLVLRAGEALLVQAIQATPANNKATDHYVVNAYWEEFTLP